MTAGPLDGIKVLEITQHVAGPYCGRLLADFGATVLKIERPEGDPERLLPPTIELPTGQSRSLLYLYLNHGKERLPLSLRKPAEVARVRELAAEADVVIENLRPGALRRLGLGWDALHTRTPKLILTSISNFGQDGPYRDYRAWDIVAEALGGLSYIYGYGDREPLTHPNPQASYRAGVAAASATVAALLNREDEGEHVDISIMECVAAALRDTIPQYTYMGAVRKRAASAEGAFGAVTPCANGYVVPTAYGAADWPTLTRFLDAPEMDDERFATGEGRQRYAAELGALLRERLLRWDKLSFFHGSQQWGIGAGIVLTPAEVESSEQLAARGYFQDLAVDDATSLPSPRGPFIL